MKWIKWLKHRNIKIFLGVTTLGIVLYLTDKDAMGWQFYNMFGVATTLALSVLAFMTYIDYAKGEDVIKIYFQEGNRKIYTDTELYTQRKHFTRSEVLGLLGMIQSSQDRFNLSDFNKNPQILERFKKIQNGKSDELIIKITEEELKQFNIKTKS